MLRYLWFHNILFLNFQLSKCNRPLYEILKQLVITENVSHINISCSGPVFWPTKGTGGLKRYIFLNLMENSTLKIFGSVDVKITPDVRTRPKCELKKDFNSIV